MSSPWLPVMSTGAAADVLCSTSYLACPYRGVCPLKSWTIADLGLGEPLGIYRTTPLERLNRSTARSFWLEMWFSGTRRFGWLPLWDFAGSRWALQDNTSSNHKSIDRSSFAPRRHERMQLKG